MAGPGKNKATIKGRVVKSAIGESWLSSSEERPYCSLHSQARCFRGILQPLSGSPVAIPPHPPCSSFQVLPGQSGDVFCLTVL